MERGCMTTTEAQKAAMRRYYHKSKNRYKTIALRLDKEADADIIDVFDNAENKVELVRELIRGRHGRD